MARIILAPSSTRQYEISSEIPDETALALLGITEAWTADAESVETPVPAAEPVAPHVPLPDRILELIRRTPEHTHSTDEIAVGLGIEERRRPTLHGALNRLAVGTDSALIRVERGQYRLRSATAAAVRG